MLSSFDNFKDLISEPTKKHMIVTFLFLACLNSQLLPSLDKKNDPNCFKLKTNTIAEINTFDNEFIFNQDKYQCLLNGYNTQRKLSPDEVFYLPLLSKAASLRFLLTRLYDWVNTPKDADVVPKNPKEYINKLKHYIN